MPETRAAVNADRGWLWSLALPVGAPLVGRASEVLPQVANGIHGVGCGFATGGRGGRWDCRKAQRGSDKPATREATYRNGGHFATPRLQPKRKPAEG